MELQDAIARRRMQRRTSAAPLDDAELTGLLDLARRGPSAGNAQGSDLVVLREASDRGAVAELAGEPGYVERGFDPWLSAAPVHVIPCADVGRYRERYAEDDKGVDVEDWSVPYWWLDLGAVVQNLLLLATDRGLAAGFLGAHAVPGLASLLRLPHDVHPAGIVTLGHPHPDGVPTTGSARRPRRPLDEVLHHGGW